MYILSWLAAVRLAALLNYHYGNIGMDYTLKRSVPQQIDPSWSNLAWDLLTAIANQASALINPNKVLAEREGFEPPIPVKVWPLSRRLVSTTHAPLDRKNVVEFMIAEGSPQSPS